MVKDTSHCWEADFNVAVSINTNRGFLKPIRIIKCLMQKKMPRICAGVRTANGGDSIKDMTKFLAN